MHLRFSINELLQLVGVPHGKEVPDGGSGFEPGSRSEFISEFIGDQLQLLAEGDAQKIASSERPVESENSGRDPVESRPIQIATDWLPSGRHTERHFGADILQTPVISKVSTPDLAIGWQSNASGRFSLNARDFAVATVQHGNEATGSKGRQAGLPVGDPKSLDRNASVSRDLRSNSAVAEDLAHKIKHAGTQDGTRPEPTHGKPSEQKSAIGKVELPASFRADGSEHPEILPARRQMPPKMTIPEQSVVGSGKSMEQGGGSATRPPEINVPRLSTGTPKESFKAATAPKDTLITTPDATSVLVSERRAIGLVQTNRSQSEPDRAKPTDRPEEKKFHHESGNTLRSIEAASQNSRNAQEHGLKPNSSDQVVSRLAPEVIVEANRIPAEVVQEQPKQSPPSETLSFNVSAATPSSQVAARPPETSSPLPSAALPVAFEDSGLFQVGVAGAEGASRSQLPSSPQSILHSVPQYSVPVDALSSMLRGLTQRRSGSEVTTTELVLEPMELGRIRVTLSGGENSGQIAILVERAETLDLVKRHLDLVRADLRASGWEATEFSLSRESSRSFDGMESGEATQQDDPNEIQSDPQEEIESSSLVAACGLTSGGGLDLRV